MRKPQRKPEFGPNDQTLRTLVRKVRWWMMGFGRSLGPPHRATPDKLAPILAEELVTLGCEAGIYILDIGGRDTPYRQYFQPFEGRYICLDIKQGVEGRVDLLGDTHRLPVRNESIGLIICFEVLEHLQEPWHVFEEFSRVLQPNGFLVLTAPQYWHTHGWPNDYYRFTKVGLSFLAGEVGFVVKRMIPMGGPGMLLAFVCYNNLGLDRDPLRRCFLGVPIGWAGFLADATIFRNNLNGPNPDTRGWAMIAQKPSQNDLSNRFST